MHRSVQPLALLILLAASSAGAQPLPEAFPALPDFAQPIDIVAAPTAGRLWVAEREGRVWAFDETPEANTRNLVVDLSSRIGLPSIDGGLQSLAVHPDGEWLAAYWVETRNGVSESVIARFRIRPDGIADLDTEREVIRIAQPTAIHNGGKILWGPDGMLYVPLGDGGLTEGLSDNGQDRTTLLGSVLRLEVALAPEATGYTIPAGNPFVGNTEGWREEIWAWGVRNPWRSSFDANGRLWLADVGQDAWEEVNQIQRGENYGWDEQEGRICPAPTCEGITFPVFTYSHTFASGGYSVTGGAVYRGTRAPELVGRYVLADLITHRLWSLDADDPSDVRTHGVIANNAWIVAFGEGASGEMYALSYSQGRVLDIGAWMATDTEAAPASGTLALHVAPNPARDRTTVTWASGASGIARVEILDALGRTIQTHTPLAQARRLHLDLSTLAPGVYVFRVTLPEGTRMTRATIAR